MRWQRRERGRSKVGGDIFGKMPEVTGRIRKSNVLTLSIDEIVFGESKNRFGTFPGGNIKIMVSGSLKALVPFVSSLSILDRMRTSIIKPRLLA